MTYRREIDGLRALAVLPVILFHAGFSAFSGGFVGVDVFFVISGYLITTIILSEAEQGKFSFINFYERRARRIMPALLTVVFACIPLSWLFLSREDLAGFSESLVGVSLFVSNVFFWRDGGYFETAAELKPLLHTWSLAVEEQFYVLFPPLIIAVWRVGRRWTTFLLTAAAVVSIALAQWGSTRYPIPSFFLLPTRAWELAVGAMAACYLLTPPVYPVPALVREVAAAIGFVMIAGSIAIFTNQTPFPSLYALVPTLGTLLIILFATQSTAVGTLLGQPVLVAVGLISYSAYLWHHPLFAYARLQFDNPSNAVMLSLSAASLLLAALSWRWIERPFRDRNRMSKQYVLSISATGSVLLIIIGSLSAHHFGSGMGGSTEAQLASLLTRHPAVYASNIDERSFVRHRLDGPLDTPNVLVLGSSRIMQVGDGSLQQRRVLNLSVSGCSVEDIIAISDIAMERLNPEVLLVGADPWLFNEKAGEERWRSISAEYYRGLAKISPDAVPKNKSAKTNAVDGVTHTSFYILMEAIYRSINLAKPYSDDVTAGRQDKIRSDGVRVYNISYAHKTESDIERGFSRNLNYSMAEYMFSERKYDLFRRFLLLQRAARKVALVLSPYHPNLYDMMKIQRGEFLDTERKFRMLAAELGIQVIGSYDPSVTGCAPKDFYDGMHPRDDAMTRIVSALH